MNLWKQLPFLLSLTLVATGFNPHTRPSEQSFSLSSELSPQAYSVEELMPFLEDMLGQIKRTEEIPELMGNGPHIIPEKIEDIKPTPRVQIVKTTPKTDRLPIVPAKSEELPALSQADFDARFGAAATETKPAAPVKAITQENPEDVMKSLPFAEEKAATPPVEIVTQTPRTEETHVVLPEIGPIPAQKPEASVTVPGGTTCAACGPKATNLSFMQCKPKNDYLETDLKQTKGGTGLMSDLLRAGPQKDNWLKNECLRSSMMTKMGEDNASFRSCAPGSNKANVRKIRPCVSENYFSLISNSFDLVARCMSPLMGSNQRDQKQELLQLFGMFHIESGMHMNAMSGTGAAGFGQLTDDAILSINRNELGDIRKVLKGQGGACARLSDEYLSGRTPMRHEVSRSCERISLKNGNPLTNMVYSIANVMQNKRLLSKDILEGSRFKNRFDLSSSDRKKLTTAVSVWAHNTGIGGMKTPLMALLNSEYRGNKKVTDVDKFLGQLKQAMLDYPHRANSRSRRKNETSKYYASIKNSIHSMEKNVGGGSCLN